MMNHFEFPDAIDELRFTKEACRFGFQDWSCLDLGVETTV